MKNGVFQNINQQNIHYHRTHILSDKEPKQQYFFYIYFIKNGIQMDINLFNINHYLADVSKGKCLISEPFSPDSYFGRSVVLITEHNQHDGTLGYILNKPIDVPFNDLIPDFPAFDGKCYIGGPVNPETLHFLHTRPDIITDSTHITGKIYWGGNFNVLKDNIEQNLIKPHEIKFYLGYSGWAPEQLKTEIESNFWVVANIKPVKIMKANENTWKELLTELGDSYTLWANAPMNPGFN